jgi:hypothetical protein
MHWREGKALGVKKEFVIEKKKVERVFALDRNVDPRTSKYCGKFRSAP